MIIYKGGKKQDRSGAAGTLPRGAQAIWDFADQYDQAKRRPAMQQDQQQFEAVQAARKAITDRQMQWEQEDRDRERLGRKADAELSQALIRGMRPPEIDTPPVQGPSADDGRPLGIEARIADSERRKWDDYERWAADPNVSPEAKKMLYAQLARESQNKLADAQWSSITRRFAQLAVPSKTMRGSDVMGLNPEDPEQAELLSNIQGMIDQRVDAEGVSGLIAELEAEILRDARMLERREATLELMQSSLTNPALAGSDQLEAMQQAWQRFQRDPGLDPDEAWNDFLDAQKRPVRDARALAGGGTGGSMTRGAPGAPANPFAPVQKFSRYQADTEGRAKALSTLDKKTEFGNPTEGEIRERMDLDNPMGAIEEGMAKGRASAGKAQAGGASSAQYDPAAVADKMGAGPRARAAAMKLDEPALNKLSGVVDAAETWQEAQDALAAELVGMGYSGPEEVPAWLTSMLLRQWEKKHDRRNSGVGEGMSARGDGIGVPKYLEKPQGEVPPLDFGEGAGARPKHISEISGPGVKQPGAEAPPKEKPTTWKRLDRDKQADLRKTLLEAVEKAARYDFHGALAPILRKAGVDLGSVPKGVAAELREALKKKRAQARKEK